MSDDAQPPPEGEVELRWSETSSATAAAAATAASEADVDDEPEVGSSSLTRVDSLTLALRAIQASGLQYGQENSANSGNSLDSSGSGSQLDEEPRPACKRASSLKVPGVSRQLSADPASPDSAAKKAVRFADALGLDLALIRTVFDLESPPVIPPEATRDLVLPPSDDEEQEEAEAGWDPQQPRCQQQQPQPGAPLSLYLSPAFAQPGSAPNFNSRIAAQKVVLERAHYQQQTVASGNSSGSGLSGQVRGIIRVANLGFEKLVRLRASLDNWASSFEVQADYVPGGGGGGGGGSDQFSFAMSLPEWLRAGDRVAFCIAYTVNGETYWDSNFGDNYAFHCVPAGSALPRPGLELQAWTRYV